MAEAAGVVFRIRYDSLPWLPGALGYAENWVFAGGAHNNHAFYNNRVRYSRPVASWEETLLHDPQTSGGLLVAVAPEHVDVFLAFCTESDQPAWAIGDVAEGAGIEIV